MTDLSMSDGRKYGRHLFEYRFDNAHWGVEIVAASPAEAEARMKALAWAQYRGEVVTRVPIPGAGLIEQIKATLSAVYGKVSQSTGD